MNICVVFEHAPHGTTHGREGLDFLLAMAAFYDQISVVFIGDGIYQLLKDQISVSVLSRDHSKTFKLMNMYDISDVYVSETDLINRNLTVDDLIIDTKVASDELLYQLLNNNYYKVVF